MLPSLETLASKVTKISDKITVDYGTLTTIIRKPFLKQANNDKTSLECEHNKIKTKQITSFSSSQYIDYSHYFLNSLAILDALLFARNL